MARAYGRYSANKRARMGWWLLIVAALVFAMVVVGGTTRLTESGLSIVAWKPLSGTIPPLNAGDWQVEFEAYQAYPEYKLSNQGMTLDGFKRIYWWEYGHRLLGRFIGLAFFLPFLWFLLKGGIPGSLMPRLILLLLLGAFQGGVGWWMVQSGLSERGDVSQYRLTAHLGLALAIFSGLLWTALGLLSERRDTPLHADTRRLVRLLFSMVFLQILLGALVAGTNAGFVYNSWPLMDGGLIAGDAYSLTPWYRNFGEELAAIQFNHRIGAYLLLIVGFATFWSVLRHERDGTARMLASLLLIALLGQIALGICTLILVVPVGLAALHQAGAVIVLGLSLALWHRQRPRGHYDD